MVLETVMHELLGAGEPLGRTGALSGSHEIFDGLAGTTEEDHVSDEARFSMKDPTGLDVVDLVRLDRVGGSTLPRPLSLCFESIHGTSLCLSMCSAAGECQDDDCDQSLHGFSLLVLDVAGVDVDLCRQRLDVSRPVARQETFRMLEDHCVGAHRAFIVLPDERLTALLQTEELDTSRFLAIFVRGVQGSLGQLDLALLGLDLLIGCMKPSIALQRVIRVEDLLDDLGRHLHRRGGDADDPSCDHQNSDDKARDETDFPRIRLVIPVVHTLVLPFFPFWELYYCGHLGRLFRYS